MNRQERKKSANQAEDYGVFFPVASFTNIV